MKKLLVAIPFMLVLLVACEALTSDMSDFIDSNAGTAAIESHKVEEYKTGENYPTGTDGITNVSPNADGVTITFTLNNPQNYTLDLDINWDNPDLRADGKNPAKTSDYTLKQDPTDKKIVYLTYKKDFLDTLDQADDGNISASITLKESKSQRAFEPYPYKLESNSPPKLEKKPLLMMDTTSGNYVVCFDLPSVTNANHRDIKKIRITNDFTGSFDEYDVTLSNDASGYDAVDKPTTKIIKKAQGLSTWRKGEPSLADDYVDTNGIFYDTEIKVGGPISYTITLTDDKGLTSKEPIDNVPSVVYIDPTAVRNGNGTEDDPVNSMEAAMELFSSSTRAKIQTQTQTQTLDEKNITLWVMGTIEVDAVDAAAAWESPLGKLLTIKRHSTHRDALVNVTKGGTLTLENIIIDGQGGSTDADEALITVDGGNVVLNGTTLQNNKNISGSGGAVLLTNDKSTLTVNGATITNNKANYGGGVSIVSGKINLAGEKITINGNTLLDGTKNNIAYTNNSDSLSEEVTSPEEVTFPVNVTGTLVSETRVGLSPAKTDRKNVLVVEADSTTLDVTNFVSDDTETFTIATTLVGNKLMVEDKIKPNITSVTLSSSNTNSMYAKSGDTLTLTVVANDKDGSDINTCVAKIKIGGTTVTPTTTTTTTDGNEKKEYTWTYKIPVRNENGAVTVDVKVKNEAENMANGNVTDTIIVDTTAPTVNTVITFERKFSGSGFVSPARTSNITDYVKEGDEIILNVFASDDGSGLADDAYAATIQIGNNKKYKKFIEDPSGTFTHTVEGDTGAVSYGVNVTDKAGNETEILTSTSIEVNNTAPSIPTVFYASAANGGTMYIKDTSTSKTYYYRGEGIKFAFEANDTGGSGIKGYTLKQNPDDSDIKNILQLPPSVDVRTDGVYKVYTVDKAHNVSVNALTLNIIKDEDRPTIDKVVMDIDDNRKITLTVTVTGVSDGVSDGASGIASYAATIKIGNNEPLTDGTWLNGVYTHTDVSAITSGALTYSVTVTDNVGNVSVASTGVAKGEGDGWAYYAKDLGWYEISEELTTGPYNWDTAAEEYTPTTTGWRLPTKAELNAAYESLYKENVPPVISKALPSASLNFLWSSSEDTSSTAQAWVQRFSAAVPPATDDAAAGYQKSVPKTDLNSVRLVRPFPPSAP